MVKKLTLIVSPPLSSEGSSPRKIWTAKMAARKVMRNTKTTRLTTPLTLPSTRICERQSCLTSTPETRADSQGDLA